MAPSASKQATIQTSTVSSQAEGVLPQAGEASTDPAQRYLMIAEAAFYIAQTRGFTHSQELDDWLAAEREIERRLASPDH
jgi:hypothetical protein